jgi:TusA-related sulfurtransferase
MNGPDEASPELGADRFYDAGDSGCAGPGLKEIRDLLDGLEPGQTLEIRTVSAVGRTDLEAWVRLRGHEPVLERGGANGDRYLVRRGPG